MRCACKPVRGFDTTVPTLSRKQINEQPERWHIHYAGVRVGLIQQRSGAPLIKIPASNDTAPPQRLIKPELRSRRHGETIYLVAPKPTSSNGARTRPILPPSIRAGTARASAGFREPFTTSRVTDSCLLHESIPRRPQLSPCLAGAIFVLISRNQDEAE